MNLWKRPGLSTRIFIILALMLAVSFGMGFTAIWYAGHYNTLLTELIASDMAALDAAREMETALANQKGYVTYYFLDGDQKWLDQLAIHRRSFENWLDRSDGLHSY